MIEFFFKEKNLYNNLFNPRSIVKKNSSRNCHFSERGGPVRLLVRHSLFSIHYQYTIRLILFEIAFF